MSAEKAVNNILTNDAPVTGVVSSRIYPVKLPQDPTYPALTYFGVSALRHSVMGNDTGIVERRVQVSAWAETYPDAKDLVNKVRNALQRVRGTYNGVEVLDIFLENDGPEIWEDQVNVYQHISDFNVIYRESV